jgi:hypothetical protein
VNRFLLSRSGAAKGSKVPFPLGERLLSEYLFAASVTIGDQAARNKGWRPNGRAAWQKRDGTTVCFICFEEQLAAVPAGVKVHRAR